MSEFNVAQPLVMHIDLNSCFATIEQQSRPKLRGRPVAVVNRRADNATIVTASYEAKAYGVATGMLASAAKRLVPGLVVVETDPPKYRYVYRRLLRVMRDYSASVAMKSIDEGVIDFAAAPGDIQDRDLASIGHEIKQRLRDEIGVWMRCNVGIGTNRFLAKMAAALHKPDGLDILTSHNIREIFAGLKLQDLTGIAARNEHRLNAVGIYTPLDMLDADVMTLRLAFRSVHGEYWYRRLRGWEVDDAVHDLQSCGRQYVLDSRSLSRQEIMKRLHVLAEDVGSKLRGEGKSARGISLRFILYPRGIWQAHYLSPLPFSSNLAIWRMAEQLFRGAPDNIRLISITCYHLADADALSQLDLFSDDLDTRLMAAVDSVNRRYGARVLHSASTLSLDEIVKTKIPFGSTRYL